MISVGVHTRHCCVFHGCKYGDADCPVWLGTHEQESPCEDCEYDTRMVLLEYFDKRIDEIPLTSVEALAELVKAKGFVISQIRGDYGWTRITP